MHLISDLELTRWVGDFIDKHKLAGTSGKVVVGLSGGPDSMLLSHICEALVEQGRLNHVRHIHIDHGLRRESGKEAFLLKEWCKKWRWKFSLKKITGPIPKSNIEAWARKERRELLSMDLNKDEVLFLGHHIDDSFEWYLRKTLNSSKGDFTFGIPLINGVVRRPFHCLTRSQIEKFVARFQIPFIEDSSNADSRFQRNALRKEVKAPLMKLFPKGMAHYVERSNQWANELKRAKEESGPVGQLSRYILGNSLICLQKRGGDFRDFEKDILHAIKELSSSERGNLRQNLEKLYQSLDGAGRPGPLSFSGGVKVRMYGETLLFYNPDGEEDLKKYNGKWVSRVIASDIPCENIKGLERTLQALGGLPYCLYDEKEFGLKGLSQDPLFQQIIDHGRELGLGFRPISFLLREDEKRSARARSKKTDLGSQCYKLFPLLR